MTCFVAATQEPGFTRAAQRCRTSQPNLTRQLRMLEENLGVALFGRIKCRIELTKTF